MHQNPAVVFPHRHGGVSYSLVGATRSHARPVRPHQERQACLPPRL